MGWKIRGGLPYYYRTIREGGRVRSVYVGKGPMAELAARVDAIKKQLGAELAATWTEERDQLEVTDRVGLASSALVDLVVGLALEAAGFRRHNRGDWRRSRMASKAEHQFQPTDRRPLPDGATRAEIVDVLNRASRGDETAMPRVRELFKADPSGMLIVAGGSLTDQIEMVTIAKLARENLAWPIALDLKMQQIRADLGGLDPTPIERLLVERVALCWLDVHVLDLQHAHAVGLTFSQAEHQEKMRDRASRRYLAALKALATVRKMGVLAVQVNIGAQQINIGETDPGPDRPD